MGKELNYVMLCGVIIKTKREYFILHFGKGKIKVKYPYNDHDLLKTGYTVHVGGPLAKTHFGLKVDAETVSIFDTKPHYLNG